MSDATLALAKKYFGTSNGELLVGGIGVNSLAEKYGTPAFIYDKSVIDQKLSALRRALPTRFSIFYSVKANPNLSVVRHLRSRGCGLEIASAGEFQVAIRAGCDPQDVLFAGPGKQHVLRIAASPDCHLKFTRGSDLKSATTRA